METLSLDQIQVMLAVIEHGSFSGAGRALNRAQSAVTYAVQKLEEQLGVALFDRSSYRPALTEAGRALLPRARQLAEEATALKAQARSIAEGVEAELTLVVDALFPMAFLLPALRAVSARFPAVATRLFVAALGASAALVLDGTCGLGLLTAEFSGDAALVRRALPGVILLPVAAPCHPLAGEAGPIATARLREHVQLVLTDSSGRTAGRDYGVYATRTWRLADLGAKHALLLAGLGWGNMPLPMVEQDIRLGRLVRLELAELRTGGGAMQLAMCAAHRADRPPGPAARLLIAHLAEDCEAAA